MNVNDLRIILKYLSDSISGKQVHEIHYNILKLIGLFEKEKLDNLRYRILSMTKNLYDASIAIINSLKNMGVENILSRILVLSILIDDPWYFIKHGSSKNEVNVLKLTSTLSNPIAPGLEMLKIIDFIPPNSRIAYFPGSIASIWVDKLFLKMLQRKNITPQVYVFEEILGFNTSTNVLISVFGKDVNKYTTINRSTNLQLHVSRALKTADLVIIRDPIVVDYILWNINLLKDSFMLNKVLLVLRWKCRYLEKRSDLVYGKYSVISADTLTSNLIR